MVVIFYYRVIMNRRFVIMSWWWMCLNFWCLERIFFYIICFIRFYLIICLNVLVIFELFVKWSNFFFVYFLVGFLIIIFINCKIVFFWIFLCNFWKRLVFYRWSRWIWYLILCWFYVCWFRWDRFGILNVIFIVSK